MMRPFLVVDAAAAVVAHVVASVLLMVVVVVAYYARLRPEEAASRCRRTGHTTRLSGCLAGRSL